MLTMVNNNSEISEILHQLGRRLKEARLARNETQEIFAARIGLTRQSYAKMENGKGSVPLINWLTASDILGCLDTWQDVLAGKRDLFEQYEKEQRIRKRASGSKR